MVSFLELPPEIRLEIYRNLRLARSLRLSPSGENPFRLGYVSYGFYPEILATNHQISHEAKTVFYGENHWTFYAAPNIPFKSDCFKLPPLSSALPFIRKLHIRFRLFNWLFYQANYGGGRLVKFRANLNQINKTLAKARSLQSVELIWTETSMCWQPPLSRFTYWDWIHGSGNIVTIMQTPLNLLLQPLSKPSYPITKGEVMAQFRSQAKSKAMEIAFSNAVDALIAQRRPQAIARPAKRKAFPNGPSSSRRSK